tara:strand:- start:6614 stop:6982 length:369 start_codon:yes stop_codon:yes gene_type:complete
MNTMLLLSFLLLVKHAIADLGLQGYIKGTKQLYLSRKLFIHTAHHGIGTFLICAFFVDLKFALLLGILDMFLHWQIDFCKTRFVIAYKLNNTQRVFWWVQAVDQILHYSTYFLIVALIFSWT